MNKDEIVLEIEKVLDEWDPIGVLQGYKPIIYRKGIIGEYTKYAEHIIEVYLSHQPIYDYLINLQTNLRGYPNEDMKEEIKLVAERINLFLSRCTIEDIRSVFKK
jgi:hypothetical protein